MPYIPTLSDILFTAGQLTECAACLPFATVRTVRVRRTADDSLSLAERRQTRACLQAARTALADLLTRYRAVSPQPEEGLTKEAARLLTLLSAHAGDRRRAAPEASALPPKTAAARIVSLSEQLLRQIDDCPSLVDWLHPDTMVGSLRSEEQYRINIEKKFYYTPVRVVLPDALPVRYVALYRSSSADEPGIHICGEVKTIRTVRRRRIPVPTAAGNGNDLYYILPVKEWTPLSVPIAVREEGVYAPRFTNHFLLTHSRSTYELFDITSETAYRLHAALSDLSNCGNPTAPPVRVTDSLSLALTDGKLILSDIRRGLLAVCPASEFASFPGRTLRTFLKAAGIG